MPHATTRTAAARLTLMGAAAALAVLSCCMLLLLGLARGGAAGSAAVTWKPPPSPCKKDECMTCTGECGACPPPPPPGVPSWQGCTTPLAQSLPYCDTSKTIDDRVDWLVANLTLVEKIRAVSPQPYLGETCGVHTCGKPSIGLPNYFWLTETNTAVAATCYHGDDTNKPYHCSTTFVGPMNMGASFNKTSWRMKGDVIGTEMRAFNNIGQMRQSPGDYVGLTGFGPNINIARECVRMAALSALLSQPRFDLISDLACDPEHTRLPRVLTTKYVSISHSPRFGRISELPSEDPVHSGVYGREMISGMQTMDSGGHPKMLAYLKHYTGYSREQNRMHSEDNITLFDLYDTYLPQYEEAFKANASGVMCSYGELNRCCLLPSYHSHRHGRGRQCHQQLVYGSVRMSMFLMDG